MTLTKVRLIICIFYKGSKKRVCWNTTGYTTKPTWHWEKRENRSSVLVEPFWTTVPIFSNKTPKQFPYGKELPTKRLCPQRFFSGGNLTMMPFVTKVTILVPLGHYSCMDYQTVPQGRHFGTVYFSQCTIPTFISYSSITWHCDELHGKKIKIYGKLKQMKQVIPSKGFLCWRINQ